jgi:glucokinase
VHVDPKGPLCYCGRNGCLEALVSGTALKNIGVERGVLTAEQNGKDLSDLAEAGNKEAVQIMLEAQEALGLGVVNLIYTYGPEKIIITGGALSRSDSLLVKLQAIADEACTYTKLRSEIKFGSLGDWAGTIGAATCIIKSL